MSFDYKTNLNQPMFDIAAAAQSGFTNPAFNGKPLEKPVEKIKEKVEEEKEKPTNKAAIAVGGGVIGLSILVALFNPRFSTKLIEKLKTSQEKIKLKFKNNPKDSFKYKFYKTTEKTLNWLSKFISSTNNINSVKDTYFKQLCTEEKAFLGTRNYGRRRVLRKTDNIFRTVFKKPHEKITQWGDSLGKHTVRRNYKISSKKMDNLEALFKEYSGRLSGEEKVEFDKLFKEISQNREFFNENNLYSRFEVQAKAMEHLNEDIRIQWTNYKHGFTNKYVKTSDHFNKNLSFWAQDIMAPKREKLNQEGINAVDKLLGKKSGKEGGFDKLFNLVSPHLDSKEKSMLEKAIEKTETSLRKANKSECRDYFDKKRDLILGSAPTDIVTAITGLTIGAISFASADDRDKRISRLLTGIAPAVAGIGTNIALTSMLFSGTKGMLLGGITGFIMSRIGSGVDHARLRAKALLKQKGANDDTKTDKAV